MSDRDDMERSRQAIAQKAEAASAAKLDAIFKKRSAEKKKKGPWSALAAAFVELGAAKAEFSAAYRESQAHAPYVKKALGDAQAAERDVRKAIDAATLAANESGHDEMEKHLRAERDLLPYLDVPTCESLAYAYRQMATMEGE